MFIRTQKNVITKINGYIKIQKGYNPSNYDLILCSSLGCLILGEFEDEESAINVLNEITAAIEDNLPLYKVPDGPYFPAKLVCPQIFVGDED